MKTILVTGASGFIANHLIQSLAQDMSVRVIAVSRDCSGWLKDFKNVSYIFADIAHMNVPLTSEVYHLAGAFGSKNIIGNPYETMNQNIVMTRNLIDQFRKTKTKIVFSSSIEVDFIPRYPSSDARWAYAESKRTCEDLLSHSCIPYSIARLSHVYGPGMTHDTVIRSLIQRSLSTKAFHIAHGSDMRSFLYIDDAVDALKTIMSQGSENFYEVGSKRSHTILQVAEIIGNLSNKLVYEIGQTEPVEKRLCRPESLESLGWFSRTSLKEGIKKTFLWYKENE